MSSTSTAESPASSSVDWRRAEFVLTGLAFLGFASLLIRITNISANLPAHPLFVHVPVVLIPLSIIGVVACLLRPQWLERYGILLCLCSILGMSSIFLAMQAGGALRGELHLTGQAAVLINEHSNAADILAFVFIAFTAILILTFSASRISDGRPTGLVLADRVLGSRASYLALRVVLVILAIVAAYEVYHVGDLGAKAVWLGKLQAAGGPPPGP
jgi:hypothetical protein